MILYELMTGAPAFNADTLPGICAAIAADAPAPVRERRPDVPPEVEAIVMRCLEKDPAKRFQSVSDLVKALAPFVPQSPASSALYASRAGVVDSLDAPIFSPDAPTIGLAPSSGPRPLANGGFANAATDPPEAMPHTMASEQGAAPGTPVPENLVGSPRKDDPAVATLVSSSGNKALSGSPSSGFGVRRVGFVVLTIAALGAAALVGVALRPSPSPPSVSSSLRAGTPPRPASFTLSIESTPSGANVFDGDRIVGKTPFTTVLDNAAVDSVPRNLMLRLDGFEPYEVSQGPSDTSVRVSAALAPVREAAHGAAQPAPSASSAAVSKPRMATSKSVLHRPAPAPASTAAPADIRLER
jgi:serine/threonine protein kinase